MKKASFARELIDCIEDFKEMGYSYAQHKIYYDSKCGQCVLNAACRNCPAYMDLEHGGYKNKYLCDLANARINNG